MSDPANKPPLLRIAFAAKSPIYAPLYAAVEILRQELREEQPEQTIELDNQEYGDRGALRKLYENTDGEPTRAELAVCDPLAVAERYLQMSARDADAKDRPLIIAFCLRRPALWAVATSAVESSWTQLQRQQLDDATRQKLLNDNAIFLNHNTHKESSLYERTKRGTVPIPPIATYSECSAQYLVEYMTRHHSRTFWELPSQTKVLCAQVSEVHDAISTGTVNGTGIPWVAVCDPEAKHLANKQMGPYDRVVFSWCRSEIFPDLPFTCLACSGETLRDRDKRRLIQRLLRHLHRALQHVTTDAYLEAAQLGYARHRYPEGIKANGAVNTDHPALKEFETVVTRLKNQKDAFERNVSSFPITPAPEYSKVWVQRGWLFGWTQLWALDRFNPNANALDVLERCTSLSLTHSSLSFWNPERWSSFFRWYWWSVRRGASSASAIVIGFMAALCVTALLYGIGRARGLESVPQVPDSIATGLGFAFWLGVVYPFGKWWMDWRRSHGRCGPSA